MDDCTWIFVLALTFSLTALIGWCFVLSAPHDSKRSIHDDIPSNDSYTPIASDSIIGDNGNLNELDYETWRTFYNEISELPTKDPDQDN